jgi:hypothetical protein
VTGHFEGCMGRFFPACAPPTAFVVAAALALFRELRLTCQSFMNAASAFSMLMSVVRRNEESARAPMVSRLTDPPPLTPLAALTYSSFPSVSIFALAFSSHFLTTNDTDGSSRLRSSASCQSA